MKYFLEGGILMYILVLVIGIIMLLIIFFLLNAISSEKNKSKKLSRDLSEMIDKIGYADDYYNQKVKKADDYYSKKISDSQKYQTQKFKDTDEQCRKKLTNTNLEINRRLKSADIERKQKLDKIDEEIKQKFIDANVEIQSRFYNADLELKNQREIFHREQQKKLNDTEIELKNKLAVFEKEQQIKLENNNLIITKAQSDLRRQLEIFNEEQKQKLSDADYLIQKRFQESEVEMIKKQNNLIEENKKIQSKIDSGIGYYSNLSDEMDRLSKQCKKLEEKKVQIEKFVNATIKKFPEVMKYISECETAKDLAVAEKLTIKSRPAYNAAEEIKAICKEKRKLIEKNKALEYEIMYIRRLIPYLDELEDSTLEPVDEFSNFYGEIDEEIKNRADFDKAIYWLTPQEYKKMSSTARNQRALDNYKRRHKTNLQIGRDYERYIGYLMEQKGYKVEYTGIQNGMNDLGRDLICKSGSETLIIQCKCWSNRQGKQIHEKHINQLYGTSVMYLMDERKKNPRAKIDLGVNSNLFAETIIPVFVSTVPFSSTAKEFAKVLGIELKQIPLGDYPMIKCNINRGEKIYHLPFDQMYDKTVISKSGEFYAMTVAEAEAKGFRRAKKWLGNQLKLF